MMRRAVKGEADKLNQLAYVSEGIWGENEAYMEAFSQQYRLTEAMIEQDLVYVMEEEASLLGFFTILKEDQQYELELFYIEKAFIGLGYGQRLWQEMIAICKEKNINRIQLVASKDVVEFYKGVGAKEIRQVKSTLQDGRIVSIMVYEIV